MIDNQFLPSLVRFVTSFMLLVQPEHLHLRSSVWANLLTNAIILNGLYRLKEVSNTYFFPELPSALLKRYRSLKNFKIRNWVSSLEYAFTKFSSDHLQITRLSQRSVKPPEPPWKVIVLKNVTCQGRKSFLEIIMAGGVGFQIFI